MRANAEGIDAPGQQLVHGILRLRHGGVEPGGLFGVGRVAYSQQPGRAGDELAAEVVGAEVHQRPSGHLAGGEVVGEQRILVAVQVADHIQLALGRESQWHEAQCVVAPHGDDGHAATAVGLVQRRRRALAGVGEVSPAAQWAPAAGAGVKIMQCLDAVLDRERQRRPARRIEPPSARVRGTVQRARDPDHGVHPA